ncbi:MAG: hypothetical protein JXB26_17800 [Candidatus Aminicenantes bacterium]|nr:hypothetical protein [Candidatus Aminicenantes bacterium]
MLYHLCLHLNSMYHPESPTSFTRLIWVSDIIGWAEHFEQEIDWQKLKIEHSVVPAVFSLLHYLTSFSSSLRSKIPAPSRRKPKGMG